MNAALKTENNFAKVYAAAIFASVLLSAFNLIRILGADLRMSDIGMMCAAVKVELSGKSPYVLSHLQQYTETLHSFPYPPLALLPLKAICAGNPYFIYPALCAAAVLGVWAWAGTCMPRDRALLLVLLLSGFEGTYFLVRTGNIEVLNLILFAAAMGFLARKQLKTAGAFVGGAAFLKVLPIVFAALFLIGKENRKDKIFAAIFAALVFSAAHLGSFLMNGDLYPDYFRLLTGQSEGHAPLKETFDAGWTHPSLLSLASLLNWKFIPGVSFFTVLFYALPASGFVFMALLFLKKPKSFTSVFSYGVLLMFLLMPRLKPYTYCLAAVPVYFLARSLSDLRKTGVLAAAVFLPFVCRALWPLSLVWEYGQLYSLVLIYGLIFLWRKDVL